MTLILRLGFVFQFSGPNFGCWKQCFQYKEHRPCFLWVPVTTGGNNIPRAVAPAGSIHSGWWMEEIGAVWENLRLIYDNTTKICRACNFVGGSYLIKRRLSWVCNVRIFFLFAVLYLKLPGRSAEAAGELHGSGSSIPFIWPELLGKHFWKEKWFS